MSGKSSVVSVISVEDLTGYRVANPVNRVFPVQAGEHTFEIRVRKSANPPSTGSVGANSSTLTAFHVPFGTVGASGTEQTEQP